MEGGANSSLIWWLIGVFLAWEKPEEEDNGCTIVAIAAHA